MLPAGDEAEALLSPLELDADAAVAGAEELLSFIELEADALLSFIEPGADADTESLLSVIEFGAGAEADVLAFMELEAGADAEVPLSAIELELCARALEIGKPMRAASAPAANTLPVRVISFCTSLYCVRREFGGEIGVAQIEQELCQ